MFIKREMLTLGLMPRFFFNIHHGSLIERDADGSQFPDVENAIAAAKDFLPAYAKDIRWDGTYDLAVSVGDEAEEVVFTASLRLTCMRPVEQRGHTLLRTDTALENSAA